MTDLVVTMPQIRDLVKNENLSPEDIFGRDYIERRRARTGADDGPKMIYTLDD